MLSKSRFGLTIAFLSLLILSATIAGAQTAPPPPPAATSPEPSTSPMSSSTTPTLSATSDSSHHNPWRIHVGPDVGTYIPFSSKVRNRFGSSWFAVGLGIGSIDTGSTQGGFGFDVSSVTSTSSSDKEAYIIPIGLQYRKALVKSGPSIPYVGVSGNYVLTYLKSDPDNIKGGLQSGAGASFFVGTSISHNGFLEARYLAVSKVKGFDFSGLSLNAGLRF